MFHLPPHWTVLRCHFVHTSWAHVLIVVGDVVCKRNLFAAPYAPHYTNPTTSPRNRWPSSRCRSHRCMDGTNWESAMVRSGTLNESVTLLNSRPRPNKWNVTGLFTAQPPLTVSKSPFATQDSSRFRADAFCTFEFLLLLHHDVDDD